MDQISGLKGLWTSRRAITLFVDTAISLLVYFLAKYAGPSFVEDAKFVIVALQPVFAVLIAAFTVTDVVADRVSGEAYANEARYAYFREVELEDSVGNPASEPEGAPVA
jgi:hypothetical protein